jgi:hypothetical protein
MSRRRKYQDHLDGAKYTMQYAVCVFNNILLNNRIEQCILNLFNAWTYILISTCIKNKIEYKKDKNTKEYKSANEMFIALQTSQNQDKSAISKNFLLIKEIRDYIVHRNPQINNKDLRVLYPKLQTCLENLQWWLCQEFGEENKIFVSFSIPLYLYEDALDKEFESKIRTQKDISYIINQFEKGVDEVTLSNPRYCRKIAIFVGELKNHQSKESINFARIPIGDDIDFNKPHTIVGLKIVSDTERFNFLPKDVITQVKKQHTWFSSHTIHHSNAFKHFTDNGNLHHRKYYIKTSDGTKWFSQEWIDFLISELSKDGVQQIIRSKNIS